MKKLSILVFLVIASLSISAQELVSATFKGSRTKTQLVNQFSNPFIRNGAKYYKVLYTSTDAKGALDTLSGLMVIPDDLRYKYPRLVYQHGTSDCKKCVPSNFGTTGGEEGQLGLIGGGLGYIAFLPDYVGMGEGRGFQTYVHAATIQRATDDLLTACESWLQENGVIKNEQLFITGYSQGGYASMAYHKYLEENGRNVTAAAHLSGPYSLSGVMRDLILSGTTYLYPAYLPNTAMGLQEVYGNLYDSLDEIFKPEFVEDIQFYYEGKITLTALNGRILQKLNTLYGSYITKNMIQPDFLIELQTNPESPINKALSDNDIYKWAPKAPTKIFYCMADDQVSFMNSIVANDTMQALGAVNLETRDVNSSADHGGCFNPALSSTIFFFLTFQQITVSTGDQPSFDEVVLSPNPSKERVRVTFPGTMHEYTVYDIRGQVVSFGNGQFHNVMDVDISSISPGIYMMRFITSEGLIIDKKLLKH